MTAKIHYTIGGQTIPDLLQYCADHQLTQFTLVADDNTFPVLGETVAQALTGQGCDVKTIVLPGPEVIPNEHFIMQVLVQADTQNRTYLAVGSGTLTDITRFVSHRTKADFISIPTAPSVDGFASIGAPLVIDGLKQTMLCQPPIAIFADLPTLCDSPPKMIASGFGDLLGKYTSLADWELGHLLWDEPYSAQIAQNFRTAVDACVVQADAIGKASPEGIQSLMDGLVECGIGILDFGESRPASGMEHHISHHLEMKIVWENLPMVLHGAKVGVATLTAADYYEKIKRITPQQAQEKLNAVSLPNREQEIERIAAAYPPIANKLVAAQQPFLNLTEQDYAQLQQKIVDNWPKIQQIAATVPDSQTLAGMLQKVGAATVMPALGLSNEEFNRAIQKSHYLRNRFTVAKLSRMLGML